MSITEMPISKLKVEEQFCSLFGIKEDDLAGIQEHMKENGFDPNRPIDVWKGRNIVIDGHTRLQAARNLGIETIPVVERHFKSPYDALLYALHNQRDRRNLNDADILNLVEKFDKPFPKGGDRKSILWKQKIDPSQDSNEKETDRDSRKITAKLIGISVHKVSQCRFILNECMNLHLIKEQISDGETSIYQVCKNSIIEREKWDGWRKKQEKARDKKMERRWWWQADDDRMSTDDYTFRKSFAFIAEHRSLPKAFDSLYEHTTGMQKIREVIEYFAASGEAGEAAFKKFCEMEPVQKFLGSLFVNDFITILKCFGYKIEKPSDLIVIEEPRPEIKPVKKKRRKR